MNKYAHSTPPLFPTHMASFVLRPDIDFMLNAMVATKHPTYLYVQDSSRSSMNMLEQDSLLRSASICHCAKHALDVQMCPECQLIERKMKAEILLLVLGIYLRSMQPTVRALRYMARRHLRIRRTIGRMFSTSGLRLSPFKIGNLKHIKHPSRLWFLPCSLSSILEQKATHTLLSHQNSFTRNQNQRVARTASAPVTVTLGASSSTATEMTLVPSVTMAKR